MARSGSVTSGDEDTFVVPSSWRRFVLPRHGDPGVKPWRPDPGSTAAFDATVAPAARQLTDLLSRVGTDTSIGEAGLEHLAGNATPLGAAAVAGLAMHELRWQVEDRPRAVADRWLAEHGPAFAARAAVELNTLSQSESRGWGPWRFTRLRPGAVRFRHAVLDANASVAVHVRAALAALPGDDYAACVEALREFRAGTVGQRVGASFVAPTETAWHGDDCAEVAASADRFGAVLMLMAVRSAADVGVLRPFADDGGHACDPHVPYTIAAGAGPAAAPVLAGWCDSGLLGAADRRRLLSILAALPSDGAFQALVEEIRATYAPAALAGAATRWPARAVRVLSASAAPERPAVVEALRVHVVAHPDAVARVLPSLPPESAGRVRELAAPAAQGGAVHTLPAVLVTPPWTVARTARPVVVPGPVRPDPPAMAWAPGERDEWLVREKFRFAVQGREGWAAQAERYRVGRLHSWEQPRFFGGGPDELVRPLVGGWRPARMSGGESWLHVVVARFELDALPMVLDAARKAPAVAAAALLPYAAPEIALAMAGWAARARAVRPVALGWLTRHPALAARALILPALGKAPADRRHAEEALRLLAGAGHRADIERAAADHGEATAHAVRDVLDEDPLEVLPARIPRPPDWADPGLLPPVRLRGGAGVLPPAAVGHLLTMLAISRPGDPYPGVALVRDVCEPGDLAEFGWGLFERWRAAGSPAKDGWALDALGLVGDDTTVRRLTPVIRAWPTEGGSARAATGLDVLATIGTDLALTHLHGISQRVRSTALRERAREKVAEVADTLDLTAEQLADRVVPDLGLDGTGGLLLDYGPRQFQVEFDEHLKPCLVGAAGTTLSGLPKPGATDDPSLAPAAYQLFAALKKDVRTVAADQLWRLETAMTAGRRWTGADFRRYLPGHPLLVHLVRRLVWLRGDTPPGRGPGLAFRVVDDGSFADVADRPVALADDDVVRIAHPLLLGDGVPAWSSLFAGRGIAQPFAQLGREVFTLSGVERWGGPFERFDGAPVHLGAVLGLDRRGWRRGDTEDGGRITRMEKDLPGGQLAVIDLHPGFVVGMVAAHADQTIAAVRVSPPGAGRWDTRNTVPPARLDPVIASELLRDLTGITA